MTVSKLTIAATAVGLALSLGSAGLAQGVVIKPLLKTAQQGLPTPLGAVSGGAGALVLGAIGLPGLAAGAAGRASLIYSLAAPSATTTTPPTTGP